MSAWTCRSFDGKAAVKIVPPRPRIPWWKGLGADSEEKREPVSDIDTAMVDSLKVLDPNRPIREADVSNPSRTGLPLQLGRAGRREVQISLFALSRRSTHSSRSKLWAATLEEVPRCRSVPRSRQRL